VTNRKLGRQPHDPTRKAIELSDILTGELPKVPPSVDYLDGLKFGMYRNSEFGVCGPTSAANLTREVTARLTGKMLVPTQGDVFKLYRHSGNPGFDPSLSDDDPRQDSNGVNMQTMLQAWMKHGLGDVKPLAFARVDVKKPEVMHAAVAIFGGQLLGVTLQKAQQSQTDAGTGTTARPASGAGTPSWKVPTTRTRSSPGPSRWRCGPASSVASSTRPGWSSSPGT
jgi:hypothetical protein